MIAGLPYDAEVEYLESTGTQWIDTGILVDWNTRVESKFRITQEPTTNVYKWFFASRDVDIAGAGFGCGWNFSKLFISDYGGNRFISDVQPTVGNYAVVKNKNTCTINSLVLTNTASQFLLSHTLPIFGLISANGSMLYETIPYASCSKFRVYSDDTLVRDFIPVRVGQVGYMYDRVTRKIFGNAGTGAFKIGPDVAKPVMGLRRFKPTARNYVQDGLVAMWDGIENAGWGVHNPNATTWKDLCGFVADISIGQYASFGDKCLNVQSNCGRIANTVSSPSRLRDIIHCQNGYSGWTIETIVGINTSLIPNRAVFCNFLSTPNTGIFGNRAIFATDSHPSYAISQITISTPDFTKSSDYVNINNGTVAKFVFIFDGTQTKLTINNSTSTSSATASPSPYANTFYSSLGFFNRSGQFAGPLYGVRFYSRALTAEDIAANYAVDKARFGLP